MVLILGRRRLVPAFQLLQPVSQFVSAPVASLAALTIWLVDSQKGQYVTHPAVHRNTFWEGEKPTTAPARIQVACLADPIILMLMLSQKKKPDWR